MFNGKTLLITGGTGSFGKEFTRRMLTDYKPKKIIIFSRDEFKQFAMKNDFAQYKNSECLRFFIGDVRDKERLWRAFNGVDFVIHAAALKQVPSCEYNPFEAVKTNITGAQNIVETALDRQVPKVVALSTDKAVNPINLYGATKLCSDKLFINANAYSGKKGTTLFSVVRYGNVTGSRGSVIPFFMKLIADGARELPVTDMRMTRFWITLDQGVDLVIKAFGESKGGETYISKIPSYRIDEVAKAIGGDDIQLKTIGIREGEKLHEIMVTVDDARSTYEYADHFIIYPQYNWWSVKNHFTKGGKAVPEEFSYTSNNNTQWLSAQDMRQRLNNLHIEY